MSHSSPQIRSATPDDAPMLARIHVQSWQETYHGLLPQSELDARPFEVRLAQWRGQIARGVSRIAALPGLGFAQMGPQRSSDAPVAGYPEELYCLYLLAEAHGTGQGLLLLNAVRGAAPFTALVLAGNARACGFYEKTGGRLLETRPDHIGHAEISERVYGFDR